MYTIEVFVDYLTITGWLITYTSDVYPNEDQVCEIAYAAGHTSDVISVSGDEDRWTITMD